AGARWAEQREHFAGLKLERNAAQDLSCAELLLDIARDQIRHRAAPPGAARSTVSTRLPQLRPPRAPRSNPTRPCPTEKRSASRSPRCPGRAGTRRWSTRARTS